MIRWPERLASEARSSGIVAAFIEFSFLGGGLRALQKCRVVRAEDEQVGVLAPV
jgi:hypothetical protein